MLRSRRCERERGGERAKSETNVSVRGMGGVSRGSCEREGRRDGGTY